MDESLPTPIAKERNSIFHAQLIEEWIEWRDQGIGTKMWSASHRNKSIRYIKAFFKHWNEVSSESVEQFLLLTPPIQVSLRRCQHAALSSFAKFLNKKKKLMSRSEYYDIRGHYPEKPKDYRRNIKVIQNEHIRPILEAIPSFCADDIYKQALLSNLIVFLSESALRISEAANLTFENLCFNPNPEQAYIHIPEYIAKSGKERYVPFSLEAQEAIRKYLKVRPVNVKFDNIFLFHHSVWGYTVLKPTSIAHIFKKLSNHCDIPFSAHTFRHYRITIWTNNPNISLPDAQYWAGHESMAVTQGYVHVRGKHSLKAAFGNRTKPSENGNNTPISILLELVDKMANMNPEERKAILGLAIPK